MDTAKDAAHTNRGGDFKKSAGFQQSALHTARKAVLFGNFRQLQILSNKEGVAIPQEDAFVRNDEEVPASEVADLDPCGFVLSRCWIHIWNADPDPSVQFVLLILEKRQFLTSIQQRLFPFFIILLMRTVTVQN
jgi:hypothetical protein